MSDFEKLKHMDIQEIHKKTRITLVRLEDILNKNFDNLDVARARGFVKILERELQLNLQDWLDEYNKYKQVTVIKDVVVQEDSKETANKQTHSSHEHPKPDLQTSEDVKKTSKKHVKPVQKQKNQQHLSGMNVEISMPKQQMTYKTIIMMVVALALIVLVVLGVYLISFTENSQSYNTVVQNNDLQKQAIERDISLQYPRISLSDALRDTKNQDKVASESSENAGKNTEDKDGQNKDEDSLKTQNSLIKEKSDNIKVQTVDMKSTQARDFDSDGNNSITSRTLTIIPQSDVWFAWKDTVTKAKGEKYTKQPITLTLANPTVFHFGYAVLTLEINGETFKFNQKGVTYMLYDFEQGFKLITQKEYKALGGR